MAEPIAGLVVAWPTTREAVLGRVSPLSWSAKEPTPAMSTTMTLAARTTIWCLRMARAESHATTLPAPPPPNWQLKRHTFRTV